MRALRDMTANRFSRQMAMPLRCRVVARGELLVGYAPGLALDLVDHSVRTGQRLVNESGRVFMGRIMAITIGFFGSDWAT